MPIWIGGNSDVALRRVARIGDGWFPLGKPNAQMRETLERLRGYASEIGRDPASIGIEAHVSVSDGDLDALVRLTETWRNLGATHISLNTMGAGFKSPSEHIQAISRYKDAVGD
jgi:alkanesulfonate monooxygenase SsuD/methylene tetrahydromethanopterin reductase-like flavin-dependent oxidoreductase (luciferase family)